MKKLYVFEYNGSYTGGSIVIICEENELNEMLKENHGQHQLISDEGNVLKYKLESLPCGNSDGIPQKDFVKLVREQNFPGQFLNRILDTLELTGDGYPGYSDGRVRLDWLLAFHIGEPADGIYKVFEIDVQHEISRIISDTFHDG